MDVKKILCAFAVISDWIVHPCTQNLGVKPLRRLRKAAQIPPGTMPWVLARMCWRGYYSLARIAGEDLSVPR